MAAGARCDHCSRPVGRLEIFCTHCGGVVTANLGEDGRPVEDGFFLVQMPDGIFRKEPVRGETIRMGRGKGCEIRIDHPRISRVHALLERRDGTYWVSDARSSGGTFLNDRPLHAPEPLRSGDTVRLGRFKEEAVTLVYHGES